mmetsp:Transcript_14520/g.37645  ORF Transcript_14520/g.37645 Transcript_14520/m.37645 type:complete len:203 (+) Transcript_14520:282-890(+)
MLFGFGKPNADASLTDEQIAEKYGVQMPRYEVVAAREGASYQLRRYQPMAIAECEYEKRPEGYTLLDGYTQGGENAAGLPMPRTAPCLMLPCGVPKLMRYMLPSPHTPKDPDAAAVPPPAPSCELVRTRTLEAFDVAVVRFSGYATPDVVFGLRDETKAALAADGIGLAPDVDDALVLAQYNELFSLPWKRDNELWLRVALP